MVLCCLSPLDITKRYLKLDKDRGSEREREEQRDTERHRERQRETEKEGERKAKTDRGKR